MNTRDDINQDEDRSLQREIDAHLTDVDPKTRTRIEEWAKKLVDLSRRNRLLYYRAAKRTSLTFLRPDADRILARTIDGSSHHFYRPPDLPPPDPGTSARPATLEEVLLRRPRTDRELVTTQRDPREIDRSLEAIERKARAEFEDRGTHVLHLTWGLLRWRDAKSGEEQLAPLALVPVELKRSSVRDRYELAATADADAVLNPALRVKLETDFGIVLPDLDPDDVPPAELWSGLRAALPAEWSLEPHASIGIFSFAKEAMYRDLVDNAAVVATHPMIQSIVQGHPVGILRAALESAAPDEAELDGDGDSGFSVIDADSSQRMAIEAANRGLSFVLHGPPGTGKSQTIANVIAEFVGRGKSVLFVSQKMAALEVVANRLEEVELRDLVLELHSAKASRVEVAQALAAALDSHAQPNDAPLAIASERMRRYRTQLNAYASALHEVRRPLGRSAFDVLSDLAVLSGVPAIQGGDVDAASASPEDLEALVGKVARLRDAWQPVTEGAGFPWTGAIAPGRTAAQQEVVSDTLIAARSAVTTAQRLDVEISLALELPAPRAQDARLLLRDMGSLIGARSIGPVEWLTHDDLAPYEDLLQRWSEASINHARLVGESEVVFGPSWRELSPASESTLIALRRRMKKVLGREPEWDAVASQATNLIAEIDRGQRHLAEAYSRLEALRERLGLGRGVETIVEARKAVQVARLSQQRHRPPAEWLSRARFDDARVFWVAHDADYQAQQAASKALLERYDERLLGLDLDPLAGRMRAWHGHWWNVIRPQYRADRSALRAVTRSMALLPTVMADLDEARRIAAMRASLLELDAEARRVLGPHATGLDTDVAGTAAALGAAEQLLALPADGTDWQRLGACVAESTAYDPWLEREAAFVEAAVDGATAAFRNADALQVGSRQGGLELWTRQELGAWLVSLAAALADLLRELAAISASRDEPITSFAQALEDVRRRREVDEIEQALAEAEPVLGSALHSSYAGFDTDWDRLRAALAWSRAVRDRYSEGVGIPGVVANRIMSGELDAIDWHAHEAAIAGIYAASTTVGALFDGANRSHATEVVLGPPEEAKRWVDERMLRITDLAAWHAFSDARVVLGESGWASFTERAIERATDPPLLEAAARRAWLESWFASLQAADIALGHFGREVHQRSISTFCQADTTVIRFGRERVLKAYADRKPPPMTVQGGEQAAVRREAMKRRRLVPVRTLLGAIPTLLPKIKPCLMMSPLSVSHFLTPDVRFDLVVFDEASQVSPEDAVNCIYRGRQLIVAGDPKQLPPTNFFQLSAAEAEGDIEEEIGDFESIMDLLRATGLPAQLLEWHYRSRSDALIAFSNHFIYNDSLVTFPAPFQESDDLGVKFVHVPDAVFDRGGSASNLVEARKVVDLVAEHMKAHPEMSIGVVAFSVAQQDAVLDEWSRRLRIDPQLERRLGEGRLNSFFVKNLETVQGDERDVIVFTVGYGRDESGKIYHNFGPLNRMGRARRLNVAVTRARRKVIVVSSIRSRDLNLPDAVAHAGSLPSGSHLLRAYLDYAERGVLPEVADVGASEGLGPLENDVAGVVRGMGYEVVERVGASRYRVDLGVLSKAHPGRIALGIECDGAMYASARTARDRDRLRESVLAGLGWSLHRIWAPAWYFNRAVEVQRLEAAIVEAQVRPASAAGALAAPGSDTIEVSKRARVQLTEVDLRVPMDVAHLPWARPYTCVVLQGYASAYAQEFHDPEVLSAHVDRALALVIGEGPVHGRYVAQRLRSAYGLQRAGNRITDAVEYALNLAARSGRIVARGAFYWPAEEPDLKFVRLPVSGNHETQRTIDLIPPEELELALLRVVEAALSIDRGTLRTQVARIFGFDRTGGKIEDSLDVRIAALVDSKRLASADGLLSLHKGFSLPRLEATSSAADPVVVGAWVRHPRLGTGRIVAVDGTLVTIEIQGDRKQIDSTMVALVPVMKPI